MKLSRLADRCYQASTSKKNIDKSFCPVSKHIKVVLKYIKINIHCFTNLKMLQVEV